MELRMSAAMASASERNKICTQDLPLLINLKFTARSRLGWLAAAAVLCLLLVALAPSGQSRRTSFHLPIIQSARNCSHIVVNKPLQCGSYPSNEVISLEIDTPAFWLAEFVKPNLRVPVYKAADDTSVGWTVLPEEGLYHLEIRTPDDVATKHRESVRNNYRLLHS